MPLQTDQILPIAENRLRFFGGPGQMLCPCPATVATVVARVPEQKLITSDLLCKVLAAQFKVRGTCPVTAKNSLKVVASEPGTKIPYWRVIKTNGELTTLFPGGLEAQAVRLKQEGFSIDTGGRKPRVENFKASLVDLVDLV
ncbi:hypothetical protein BH09VER1_BH09VER1_27100 [soil metagenome]